MTYNGYKASIPHFCTMHTYEHFDGAGGCWGISRGHVGKSHDVEGPHYCHTCIKGVCSKRLMSKATYFITFLQNGKRLRMWDAN